MNDLCPLNIQPPPTTAVYAVPAYKVTAENMTTIYLVLQGQQNGIAAS